METSLNIYKALLKISRWDLNCSIPVPVHYLICKICISNGDYLSDNAGIIFTNQEKVSWKTMKLRKDRYLHKDLEMLEMFNLTIVYRFINLKKGFCFERKGKKKGNTM